MKANDYYDSDERGFVLADPDDLPRLTRARIWLADRIAPRCESCHAVMRPFTYRTECRACSVPNSVRFPAPEPFSITAIDGIVYDTRKAAADLFGDDDDHQFDCECAQCDVSLWADARRERNNDRR